MVTAGELWVEGYSERTRHVSVGLRNSKHNTHTHTHTNTHTHARVPAPVSSDDLSVGSKSTVPQKHTIVLIP